MHNQVKKNANTDSFMARGYKAPNKSQGIKSMLCNAKTPTGYKKTPTVIANGVRPCLLPNSDHSLLSQSD